MSSTSTIPRIKTRGGSRSKITTTKTLTPLSYNPASKRSPGYASGPAHKSDIRPIPRSDGLDSRPKYRPRGRAPSQENGAHATGKSQTYGQRCKKESHLFDKVRNFSGGNVAGENRAQFSDNKQTNAPRCRNETDLCDKNRNFSDHGILRGENGARFSDKTQNNNQRYREGSDLCNKYRKFSGDGNGGGEIGAQFSDNSEDNGQRCQKESGLCGKDRNFSGGGNVRGENGAKFSDKSQIDGQRCREGGNLCEKGRKFIGGGATITKEGRVLESSVKGLDLSEGKGINGRVGSSKNTSKLHEKLAYLEGKVKRIASDINKMKELLDLNNTDASKLILSDIQEKILGIEKAVGNMIVDSSLRVNSGRASCSGDNAKVSVKGLSDAELEARFLLHQKLLRDRTLLKVSDLELGCGLNVENSVNPVEEDLIALEFLASLNKVQPDISANNKNGTLHNVSDEVKETDETNALTVRQGPGNLGGNEIVEVDLQVDERLDEFDDQENNPAMIVGGEIEDGSIHQLIETGRKTSTGGWFVSEGESVLLAHDDGSCSFYDIANQEEKAEYRPPSGISQNIWRDCWIIRAPGADGCSGKHVVAASAGNTMDSGFCSWDFYTKEVQAFHSEDSKTAPRVVLDPLPDNLMYRRTALGGIMSSENQQWWYRPCGPLIVSTASSQRGVKVFDIRDGEEIMKWNVQNPVLAMDYSSPLQWRNRGKVVVAETEGVSLWDVSSLNSQPLSSVSTSGHRILALHVNNSDAELGGGVRQRVSSSEAEGNDGVFCTCDSINILDFRNPSGIGLKIPKINVNFESVSTRGDSVFLGCTTLTSTTKKQVSSQVLQFSLRNQRILNIYNLPESNSHSHHIALTQVWGNSNLVMAVSGLGLFIFNTARDDILQSITIDYNTPQKAREVTGPDDMYSPSFDYTASQVLLISRDRPALWRHLS